MRGSVRFKLVLLFVAVGLVPLAAVASISYLFYADNLLTVTADVARYNSEWAVDNLEKFFLNAENTASIIDSRNTDGFLRDPEDTPKDAWEILALFDLYEKSLFDSGSLQNVSILALNGKCIGMRDGFYRLPPERLWEDVTIRRVLRHEGERSLLLPPDRSTYSDREVMIETVSLGRKLRDATTLEILGVIILDFYPEEIEKYYKNVKGDVIGQMDLARGINLPDSSTGMGRYRPSSLRDGLTINKPIPYDDWHLTYRISYGELRKPLDNVLRLTLLVSGLSVVLIVIAFLFISKQVISPLKILRTHMQEAASGDFTTRFELKTDDQVMVGLRDSFNTMVLDLESLITQKDREHANYLQAHFRMLQQQINPHFLYNTMDTIIWMTLEKRNEDVIELVESLSTFFRLNLSQGIDIITVADSVLCLESYLSIQKMRYSESLDYLFDIQPNIRGAKVLKLILQPIVENALYHGVQEKGGGTISISGSGAKDQIVFTVEDDGVGMTREELERLVLSLSQNEEEEDDSEVDSPTRLGFGLRNVQQRIQLYYGPEYGLSISSKEGAGTAVTITLPWNH